MKRTTLLLLPGLILLLFACQKNDNSGTFQIPARTNPAELDAFIQSKMESEGEFLWSWASDEQFWTALSNSDYVMSVGYKPAGETGVEDKLHLIDIQSPAWRNARAEVLRLALESERALNPGVQENRLTVFPEHVLPVITLRIVNPATIALLRQSPLVRYAEPMGYEPRSLGAADRSGSGCDSNNPDGSLVSGVDYTNISPACKQSWNHSFHKITEAWNNSTGAGIKVVIIDTGCSDDQDNLGDNFNQGNSSGRTIEKYVTLPQETNFWGDPVGPPETPHDQCGHGTSMQGACLAPRGTDGASVGVGYNANLVSIRAAADVFLDESREVQGVSTAFTQAGNDGAVRIISMSMGRITSSSQIRDAIKFAYNKGKMVFAAAGTSFWWSAWFAGVIFPASMTECVAVTGIKDNLTSRCSNCHQGSKVDFVVVMEKSSGKNPLSLAMEGDDPSTVGGSSVATATTAGIAALVWAKNPGFSRQQVFDKLKTNSNYYPTRHGNFGWGRINAQNATN